MGASPDCVKCRGTGLIPGSIRALDQHCDCDKPKPRRTSPRVVAHIDDPRTPYFSRPVYGCGHCGKVIHAGCYCSEECAAHDD